MSESLKGTLETILVVDDNALVLKVVSRIVEGANFCVLQANNGAEAIALAKSVGNIDLLLSDVDMPVMTGPELGQELKKTRKDMHVMLMSGGGIEGNLLVLNYGWAFIQKPILNEKLVEMVSDVLHSKNRSQPGGHEYDSRKDDTCEKKKEPDSFSNESK